MCQIFTKNLIVYAVQQNILNLSLNLYISIAVLFGDKIEDINVFLSPPDSTFFMLFNIHLNGSIIFLYNDKF